MSDHLIFPKANPVRVIRTEFDGLNYNNPDNLLFHEWSQPHSRSYCQPFEQKDTIYVQFESSFDNNFLRLVDHASGNVFIDDESEDPVLFEDGTAVESEDSGSFEFEGADGASTTVQKVESGYKVFQGVFPLTIQPGKYKLVGYGSMDSSSETYKVESELIEVRAEWKNSILFEYYNNEPAFGIDYRTGVVMEFRLLADFIKDADKSDFENITAASSVVTKLLDITIEIRKLEFYEAVPSWMIKIVNLILGHDSVEIDGVEVTGGERLKADFGGFGSAWDCPSTVVTLKNSDLTNRHDASTRILY